MFVVLVISLLSAAARSVALSRLSSDSFRLFGAQAVKIWQLEHSLKRSDEANLAVTGTSQVVQSTFTQPLDHFDSRVRSAFEQRYWANPQFYKPGGPVILLDGGEISGTDRLPFIVTGVAAKLANATGGLCLILEHRYYGDSIPVDKFSTDALRWLTNDQAAADSANFMANVNFTTIGITTKLNAPETRWIYYGGSYAGARSAHMRILYPHLVHGAIASSGVTHANVSFWQYFDVVRKAAPGNCSTILVNAVKTIDFALSRTDFNAPLKRLFGLGDLADDDFSSLISVPLSGWQGSNWDPAIDGDSFTPFCEGLAMKPSDIAQDARHISDLAIDDGLRNYANYIQANFVAPCEQVNQTIRQCFGTTDDANFQANDLSQTWRPWQFQVCTTWGFFIDAPPLGIPPIAAKSLTVPYLSKICKQAFPPGEFFTLPKSPDVDSVNVLGGYHIAADRLAIIDGELDPWRPGTPHSQYAHLQPRTNTQTRPFILISGAVHHWDKNGLANTDDEPPTIKAVRQQEIGFVQAWLKV